MDSLDFLQQYFVLYNMKVFIFQANLFASQLLLEVNAGPIASYPDVLQHAESYNVTNTKDAVSLPPEDNDIISEEDFIEVEFVERSNTDYHSAQREQWRSLVPLTTTQHHSLRNVMPLSLFRRTVLPTFPTRATVASVPSPQVPTAGC